MGLEKLLDGIKKTGKFVKENWTIFGYGAVGLYLLGIGLYSNHIKHNLEPNSIYCGYGSNIVMYGKIREKNKDLDKNGKFESILIFKKDGNKFYQEIIQNPDGSLQLGPMHLYKQK